MRHWMEAVSPCTRKTGKLNARSYRRVIPLTVIFPEWSANGCQCRRHWKKIQKEAGTRFDERIIHILVSKIARYPVGTTVKMDNQTEGVVISQTIDPESPVIMVLTPDEEKQKSNLMLEKDISILQII